MRYKIPCILNIFLNTIFVHVYSSNISSVFDKSSHFHFFYASNIRHTISASHLEQMKGAEVRLFLRARLLV